MSEIATCGTGAPPIGGVPLLRRHHAPASVPEHVLGLDGEAQYGMSDWPIHAVMTVDPGGTTGLVGAHVQVRSTMRETCEQGMLVHKGVEVRGYWLDQAREVADSWRSFQAEAVNRGIHPSRIHLVCENYLPDPRRMGSGAVNLDPVWIGAAVCGLLEFEPVWQTPAQAKQYATNDRLRQWGLWVVGSEHMRDANRHLATYVNKLIR